MCRDGRDQPLVVAHGGFSGLFPSSSYNAYALAVLTSVPDVIMWCDVQLTKDSIGIYFPNLNLDNSSTIATRFADMENTYNVNGVVVKGYFPIDFTLADLDRVFFMTLYKSLQFVDNGLFAVDGVLSDNPITPSAAFAKPLIISYEGASGDYPGCTDLAYQKAVSDGADVIDCPVQITSEGIPVCLGSVNLLDTTTVAQSGFTNLTSSIPNLRSGPGIFTFSLTWGEIRSLKHISEFANSVIIGKESVFPRTGGFLVDQTEVVAKLHAFKLPVYVQLFDNEFASQPWDLFLDPYVEINSYVNGADVDGVITYYPATASKYRTEAPLPVLEDADVAQGPIPPSAKPSPPSGNDWTATPAGFTVWSTAGFTLELLFLLWLLGQLLLEGRQASNTLQNAMPYS
ncbi:hypothetical protein L1987_19841 [Smallanthus sonchifolius]|uniref:Uncharacterized protein n=1 Tax=Smallanthus sonchifolius TaxID=185202 RepID=A0ACB9IS90_9ASTR|nr:hypothetical protein L1987_19841 [Smallanthus sonchifolius]